MDQAGPLKAGTRPRSGLKKLASAMRRRRRLAAGLAMLAALALFSLGASLVAGPSRARPLSAAPGLAPSWAHPLGTDDHGRELLAAAGAGAMTTIGMGLLAGAFGVALGAAVGLVSGYVGGALDAAVSAAVDTLLTVPGLMVLVTISSSLRESIGPGTMALVVASLAWMRPARAVRAQVLSMRRSAYVDMASLSGMGTARILALEILPNLMPYLAACFASAVSSAVLATIGLEALGLGPEESPTLGMTIYRAVAMGALLRGMWWWWAPPVALLVVLFTGLFLVASGLDEVANARLARVASPPSPGERAVWPSAPGALLEIRDLSVRYETRAGRPVQALSGLELAVRPGERVALIGESGSGKTTLARAVLGLVRGPARLTGGAILFEGTDLAGLAEDAMRRLRLASIAYIPQDAMSSLNPVMRAWDQAELAMASHGLAREELRERMARLWARVGLPPEAAKAYPHELSGGMRQRVCIAIAVSLRPRLLVADEPTSALDVVVQRRVLQTLAAVQRETGAAAILASHDVALAAQFADRIGVMYAGRLVELGATEVLLGSPLHPYTRTLVAAAGSLFEPHGEEAPSPSLPSTGSDARPSPAPEAARGCAFFPRCPFGSARCAEARPPFAEVAPGRYVACFAAEADRGPASVGSPLAEPAAGQKDIAREADGRTEQALRPPPREAAPILQAVELRARLRARSTFGDRSAFELGSVSFSLDEARPSFLAVAGESGSGKTTLARLLVGFLRPSSGRVLYRGRDIWALDRPSRRLFRREVQAILQDPYEVFNPFYKVDHLLLAPARAFGLASSRTGELALVEEALSQAGLDPKDTLGRRPWELSGGQRQRVALARAFLLRPKVVVADEPVSMVDASHRASILRGLLDLHRRLGVSLVYVTHDLATVRQVAGSLLVLFRGAVVETGPAAEVIAAPAHPYTRELVASVPTLEPSRRWEEAAGVDPNPAPPEVLTGRPAGCAYLERCASATERCRRGRPPLFDLGGGRAAACFLCEDGAAGPEHTS